MVVIMVIAVTNTPSQPGTTIDAKQSETSWDCFYLQLSDANAVWLPMGSVIECRCHVDASDSLGSPRYSVEIATARPGEELMQLTRHAWRGEVITAP